MFSDHTSEVVGFPSVTHKKRDTASTESQTPSRERQDDGSQTKTVESMETQTDQSLFGTSLSQTEGSATYDEEALAVFLRGVAPILYEELEIKVDFSDLDEENEDNETSGVRLATYKPLPGSEMKVCNMSWNCTGGTLAVALSALRHDTWCSHEGQFVIHTTNLNRPSVPRVIQNTSCVTSIAFHPWEPSILAVGLYHGEVTVWDLRKEEDWAAKESLVEHTSHVVHVGWFTAPSGATCFSAGADGCILLRKISFPTGTITVTQRFMITRGHLKLPNPDEGLEITALTQTTGENGVVAVGAGGLLHINVASLNPLLSHPDYTDPVALKYQPHRTIVTSLRTAPDGKSFASVSSDGEIRIYKHFQVEPKSTVHMKGSPLDAFWTDSSTILGVSGLNNKVFFVRTTTGQTLEFSIDVASKGVATILEANSQRGTVAVGDAGGGVEVWKVTMSKLTG